MYKQFLYCLTLAMSMSHLSAATRVAYDRVEQEEDDRSTLTKVFDIVCDAAPYCMSIGALWFCYGMHQTHDKHAADLKQHAERLQKLESDHKISVDQANAKLEAVKDGAKRDRASDLEANRTQRENLENVVRELQGKIAQQKAQDGADASKLANAPKPIKVDQASPDVSDNDEADFAKARTTGNPEHEVKAAAGAAAAKK